MKKQNKKTRIPVYRERERERERAVGSFRKKKMVWRAWLWKNEGK